MSAAAAEAGPADSAMDTAPAAAAADGEEFEATPSPVHTTNGGVPTVTIHAPADDTDSSANDAEGGEGGEEEDGEEAASDSDSDSESESAASTPATTPTTTMVRGQKVPGPSSVSASAVPSSMKPVRAAKARARATATTKKTSTLSMAVAISVQTWLAATFEVADSSDPPMSRRRLHARFKLENPTLAKTVKIPELSKCVIDLFPKVKSRRSPDNSGLNLDGIRSKVPYTPPAPKPRGSGKGKASLHAGSMKKGKRGNNRVSAGGALSRLPITRIKSTMKLASDLIVMSDAVVLTAVATELFLDVIVKAANKHQHSNMLTYDSVAEAVSKHNRLEFLNEAVPERLALRDVLRLQNADDSDAEEGAGSRVDDGDDDSDDDMDDEEEEEEEEEEEGEDDEEEEEEEEEEEDSEAMDDGDD